MLFSEILPEQAFTTAILNALLPFVGALVLAALLCAVMFSADSCLLSASSIFTLDIISSHSGQPPQLEACFYQRAPQGFGIIV